MQDCTPTGDEEFAQADLAPIIAAANEDVRRIAEATDTETLPQIAADPWIRFDMWAERAWEQSMLSVQAQQEASEASTVDDHLCPLAMVHDLASNTAVSLAEAARRATREAR